MIELDLKPDNSKLRSFGIISALFFGAWALWFYYGFGLETTSLIFALISTYSIFSSAFFPKIITPLFIGLSFIAYPIGFVVSNLILFVIFFLLFVPIGLVLRLTGNDVLEKSFSSKTSAWVDSKKKTLCCLLLQTVLI